MFIDIEKMRRLNFIGLILLFCASLTISSCSSSRLAKLDGQWQLFWINDLADENIYIWEFTDGELTIVEYQPPTPANPTPTPIIGARAQYKTSAEFTSAVVEISGFVQSAASGNVIDQISNGKWTIDVVDDEVMRIATADQEGSNGSYVIREFTRVQ